MAARPSIPSKRIRALMSAVLMASGSMLRPQQADGHTAVKTAGGSESISLAICRAADQRPSGGPRDDLAYPGDVKRRSLLLQRTSMMYRRCCQVPLIRGAARKAGCSARDAPVGHGVAAWHVSRGTFHRFRAFERPDEPAAGQVATNWAPGSALSVSMCMRPAWRRGRGRSRAKHTRRWRWARGFT